MKVLKAYKLDGSTKTKLNVLDIGKNIGNSFVYGSIDAPVKIDFKAETIQVSFSYFQMLNGVRYEIHKNVLKFPKSVLDGLFFQNGGTHPFDDMEIMLMNVFRANMTADFVGGINTSYPCDGIDIIEEEEVEE